MKLKDQRGFAEVVVLYFVIGILAALFIPNPVSSALGVGVRPNKTVQVHKETIEPLVDVNGKQVAFKSVTNDSSDDIQQHVGLWEQFRSLPTLFLILVICGALGVPGFGIVWTKLKQAYQDVLDWKNHTHQIVLSVDAGLDTLPDDASRQKFKDAMKMLQDNEVQTLVGQLQQPTLPKV